MAKLPDDPVCVVTGAGSGLGRAFCRVLGARGARLVAADIGLPAAEETARLAVSCGAKSARAVRCDVGEAEQVEALVAQTEANEGPVDLLVNNAGVAVGGVVGDTPLEDWHWLMRVNLWGVVYGCHAAAPRMKARGRGAILNVASAAGLVSAPGMAPYNASKAAVVALSETLAAELHGSGVGVTVLCPSFFQTNIAASARSVDERARAVVDKLMARSKLDAEGVARAALRGVERGDLYAVPMLDGLAMWLAKRAWPEGFASAAGRMRRKLMG